jgi:hypothetical protein
MDDILIQNEVFAKFMGYEGQHEDWCGNNILVDSIFAEHKDSVSYDVHKDWNWIMEIIFKLEEYEGIRIVIDGDNCKFKYGSKTKAEHEFFNNKILSVYAVITIAVDFVKARNK